MSCHGWIQHCSAVCFSINKLLVASLQVLSRHAVMSVAVFRVGVSTGLQHMSVYVYVDMLRLSKVKNVLKIPFAIPGLNLHCFGTAIPIML